MAGEKARVVPQRVNRRGVVEAALCDGVIVRRCVHRVVRGEVAVLIEGARVGRPQT